MNTLGDIVRVFYMTGAALLFSLMFHLIFLTPKHYPMPLSRKVGLGSQAVAALGLVWAAIIHWGDPFSPPQLVFCLFLALSVWALFLVGHDREDYFKDV